ncbi:chemotaxis protein CheW [Pseudaeromonas sharmana]|uniref:Chemotaxis protein CheW n=1 Tax=Pseudaeromonas sharmana TaxID=328412 RepID=A0ABV8CJY9_9GAMM
MSQDSQFKAMDSYFHSLLNESVVAEPAPVVQPAPEPAVVTFAEPQGFAEQEKLQALLADVERVSKTEIKTPQKVSPSTLSTPVKVAPPAPPIWKNIETGREFQALFFVVSGVTFAVPLTELGGIHQLSKINTLFGKPDWFAGVMTMRDSQLNVVDTTRWIMPGQVAEQAYEYLVMLGNSQWGLACHQLIGTELLLRDRIQWRSSAGKRPWLAGMVKDKMCALLHVQELLLLLEKGLNIEGC